MSQHKHGNLPKIIRCAIQDAEWFAKKGPYAKKQVSEKVSRAGARIAALATVKQSRGIHTYFSPS